MPKVVDRDERRSEICAAVWAIAGREGLHAVRMRDVAREAGVSLGRVQHYYADKDAMLVDACRRLVALAAEGLGERLHGGDPEGRGALAVLTGLAEQSLPDGAGERAGAAVWAAFVAHAPTHPGIAAVVRQAWEGAREFARGVVARAVREGECRADLDPDAAADVYLLLVDALVLRVLVGDRSREQALRTLSGLLAGWR
jgi:AcrR family transcriptional regulator